MVIKPFRITHLNEPRWGMTQEQQLRVAEAVLEVREEGRWAAGNSEGVVHEAAGLRLIRQRNPRAMPLVRQRFLPGMRQVESVPHFVTGSPEDHSLHPG